MKLNNLPSLSIDIGGTKIHAAIFNEKKLSAEITLKTSDFFKKNGIKDMENLIEYVYKKFKVKKFNTIGISINCAISNNTVIYSSLLNGGENINLESLFKKNLQFKQFISDNDVICMAKAEMQYGIGKKQNNFTYINLGTGIRCVHVDNGIHRGYNGLAGEISILNLWSNKLKKTLKADDLLAGKGIRNISKILGQKETTAEAVFSANNQKIIDIYVKELANFLLTITYFYNPKIIVLGGSITKSQEIWLPKIKDAYYKNKPDFFLAENIVISRLQHPATLGALL